MKKVKILLLSVLVSCTLVGMSQSIDKVSLPKHDAPISYTNSFTDLLAFSLDEGFESTTFPPTGWSLNPTTTYWIRAAVSANGSGSGSAEYNFYNSTTGTTQEMISSGFTASVAGDSLYFNHAYAGYTGSIDSLRIYVSTDGGTTYSWLIGYECNTTVGSGLTTAPAQTGAYTPTAAQWGLKKLPLPIGVNKVKFTAVSDYGNNLYIDNIRVGVPSALEISASGISSPNSGFNLTATETVTLNISNNGSTAATGFNVGFIVDGGTPVIEPYSGTIAAAGSGSHTFTATANLSANGNHIIKAFVHLTGDPNPVNDTVTKAVSNCLQSTVIFDNDTIVTHPGQGFGGADYSFLETPLTSYGLGCALATNYRLADDFIVPAGQTWTVDGASFYNYQTGSTTTSTINHVNFRIWNGNPMSGGTIVFGDTTTNVLSCSAFSNVYRGDDATYQTVNRPVMNSFCSLGTPTTLVSGTYWIDWQIGGTLASGPWNPPVTKLGDTITGNGIQKAAGVWTAIDGTGNGAFQGFPFKVYGSILVNTNDINAATVNIYPNPTSTEININANQTINNLYIVNVLGETIYQVSPGITNAKINTSNYKSGVYFVKIETDKSSITRKIQVVR